MEKHYAFIICAAASENLSDQIIQKHIPEQVLMHVACTSMTKCLMFVVDFDKYLPGPLCLI